MNKLFCAGRLTNDPELKTVGDRNVCALNVAVDITAKKDEKETIFYRVNVWGPRGETCAKWLKKGSFVTVCGNLKKPRTWTSKDGTTVNVSLDIDADTVDFGPSKSSGESTPVAQSATATATTTVDDDEVPF